MLFPLHGKSMICHVVDTASSLRPIIVVGNVQVREVIGDRGIAFVDNDEPGVGLSHSLALGIRAVPGPCDGAVVMLGDMPVVLPSTLESLACEALGNPRNNAVVPVHEGRRGNPVLLRRQLFEEASRLSGDTGARGLLLDAIEMEVADRGILLDVDAPDDVGPVSELLLYSRGAPESN